MVRMSPASAEIAKLALNCFVTTKVRGSHPNPNPNPNPNPSPSPNPNPNRAEGVDRLAEAWAEARGVAVRRVLPDWKRFGKAAGVRRNLEMLQIAHGVLAVWDG